MTTYQDREGVWMIYDYDVGSYVMTIFKDVTQAARQQAQQAYGRVGFWPFDLDRDEAISWWESVDREVNQPDGAHHMRYMKTGLVVCKNPGMLNGGDIVMVDSFSVLVMCQDCQKVLKEWVQ